MPSLPLGVLGSVVGLAMAVNLMLLCFSEGGAAAKTPLWLEGSPSCWSCRQNGPKLSRRLLVW